MKERSSFPFFIQVHSCYEHYLFELYGFLSAFVELLQHILDVPKSSLRCSMWDTGLFHKYITQTFLFQHNFQCQYQVQFLSTYCMLDTVLNALFTITYLVSGMILHGRCEYKGSCYLMGIAFQFCKMKSSGDLLYNNVKILNHTLKNC